VTDAIRTQPFDLLFGAFRNERFPAIRASLGERDGINDFMLAQPALELMRELRPEEGLGDAVDDFVALVHAAYLFWRDGEQTVALDEGATRSLVGGGPERSSAPSATRATTYVQVAPRVIWGQLDPDAPFEPLDGWFGFATSESALRMVACFGVHPERPGVSVVAVEGTLPVSVIRPDGTAPFSPTMSGGDAAGLHAVNGPEELLLLGWRASGGRAG